MDQVKKGSYQAVDNNVDSVHVIDGTAHLLRTPSHPCRTTRIVFISDIEPLIESTELIDDHGRRRRRKDTLSQTLFRGDNNNMIWAISTSKHSSRNKDITYIQEQVFYTCKEKMTQQPGHQLESNTRLLLLLRLQSTTNTLAHNTAGVHRKGETGGEERPGKGRITAQHQHHFHP